MDDSVLDDIIKRLLSAKNGRTTKQVQLTETEIRQLCSTSKEIFLSQPNLLELEAPIKICALFNSVCFHFSFVISHHHDDDENEFPILVKSDVNYNTLGPVSRLSHGSSHRVFNVDDFGAKGDGTDDRKAFKKTWKKACSSEGGVFLVPNNRTYHLRPMNFTGPCKSSQVQLKPLMDQLARVKDLAVPEFGTLLAWELRASAAARAANGDANGNDPSKSSQNGYGGPPMPFFGETKVEVAFSGTEGQEDKKSEVDHTSLKVLPPWMIKQGMNLTKEQRGGEVKQEAKMDGGVSTTETSEDKKSITENDDKKNLQDEYVKAYYAALLEKQKELEAATKQEELSNAQMLDGKHETAVSRWSRARTRAAKVGKGLSKDEKARKLALQHWLDNENEMFMDIFNTLPVAALIDEKILCMHGGLSPDLKHLDQIRNIARPVDVPDQGLLCDTCLARCFRCARSD
ncbi:hypothetical protein G4B88_025158 [Cannabis sativa]|nr:hypothetical protein G4B88_025158 [Cannabis sativa]